MAKLLGKEVAITNSKLVRFASEKKIKLDQLSEMDLATIIDLIAHCSELTVEQIEKELDKDMAFAETLANVVTESLQIKGGGEGKQIAKPIRKAGR